MKFLLNLFFLLFSMLIFGDKSFSLTDYQIKEVCKKNRNESTCIKNMREKKYNLQKGNVIQIRVIPYRK